MTAEEKRIAEKQRVNTHVNAFMARKAASKKQSDTATQQQAAKNTRQYPLMMKVAPKGYRDLYDVLKFRSPEPRKKK